MDIETAIQAAIEGEGILFTGAGFSLGATNVAGRAFKAGRSLGDHLAEKSGIPNDVGLTSIAEYFAEIFSTDSLIRLLRDEFTAKETTPSHGVIASLPWKRIYTTNYDNVLEQAAIKNSKPLTSLTLDDKTRNLPEGAHACVHINGYIDRLDRDTIWNEIKLLDSSYAAASVTESAWTKVFRQDVRNSKSILFVGYSLADLDIKRILFESKELREKCVFVVGSTPGKANEVILSKYGSLLKIDSSELAAAIQKVKNEYSPRDLDGIENRSLVKHVPQASVGIPSDKDVFDLLFLGEMRSELAVRTYADETPYYIKRDSSNRVVGFLDAGKQIVVIHSELGNGKTLLLEWLKHVLVDRSYEVYDLRNRSSHLFSEIERTVTSPSKKVILVDDYPDWLEEIEHIGLHMSMGTSLILTARSSSNDIMIDRLSKVLNNSQIVELSVDSLLDDDLDRIVNLFDHYGLWGDNAADSAGEKRRFLAQHCKGEFSGILLKLFASQNILDRYKHIFSELDQSGTYRDIIYSILAGVVLKLTGNQPMDLNMMMDIWGDKVNEAGFRRHPVVSQIVDIERGTVRLRSAVAAEHIVNRIVKTEVLVDVLVRMAKAFDDAARLPAYRQNYKDMMQKLMMFRNLQILLPEKNRRQSVISYYENVKNLYHCRENPNFWLQYAIACLVVDELDRASKYFQNAYSFATKRAWTETHQIDNHYARYLLLNAMRLSDAAESMIQFRKAAAIIERQISKERLHYPYRVATTYREFVDSRLERLTDKDRRVILDSARFVRKRIEKLADPHRQNKYVVECAKAMEHIIQITTA